MYKLKLNAKGCISCGICMDVCVPKAINMRIHKGKTLEGNSLAYLAFNDKSNSELPLEKMMTFPYMQNAEMCDGCMICVMQCPTSVIGIEFVQEVVRSLNEEAI